jgi:copper homeostasis protein
MSYKLEVIAFTIESCLIIQQSGAHRIELCDNAFEGGTTPSYGMIKAAREKVTIDLFPIIRPRGGDFLYNEDEFKIIWQDVKLCKQLGCNGVVTGFLNADGSIDIKRTSHIVEIAHPMQVTFHRAFDHCKDPFKAVEQLVDAGCSRILTSGQQPMAAEGADLIAHLIKFAGGKIILMPGSGVRNENIKMLADKTGAVEFHTSLRSNAKSTMDFIHPAFKELENTYSHPAVIEEDIRALLKALNN